MTLRVLRFVLAASLTATPAARSQQVAPDTVGQSWKYDSWLGSYEVEVVATGLHVPFGLAFLPDGRLLVSDRHAGHLSLLNAGSGKLMPLRGGPVVFDSVDAGLLDVAVHPGFDRNGWIYYAYSE